MGKQYMRFTHGNFTPSEMVTAGNFSIYLLEMFLLGIGVVGNIILIVALMSTASLHLNFRILLCNFCFGFFVMTIGRIMIALPLCFAHLTDIDITNHIYCSTANSIHHIGVDQISFSYVFIMLERVVGTFASAKYEKRTFHWFCLIFVILQWIIPGSLVFASHLDRENRISIFKEFPHLPCQIDYLTPKTFLATITTICFGSFVSFVGIVLIYFMNIIKHRNNHSSNLSERYQISENLRSTHHLFPLLCFSFIFLVSAIAVIIYGSYWVHFIQSEPSRYEEVVKYFGRGGEASQMFDIILAVYSIFFPSCAFKCYPNLLRRLRNVMFNGTSIIRPFELKDIRGYCITNASSIAQTSYHFDSLNDTWNRT